MKFAEGLLTYVLSPNVRVYNVTPEDAYEYYDDYQRTEQSGGRYRDRTGAAPARPSSGLAGGGSSFLNNDDDLPEWAPQEDDTRGPSSYRPWLSELDDSSRQQERQSAGSSGFNRGFVDFGQQQQSPPPDSSSSDSRRGRPRTSPGDNKRRNQEDDLIDDWGV
jgi:hypothetical protein